MKNVENMDVPAGKGYQTGNEIEQCEAENITAYVSPKAPATKGAVFITGCNFKVSF